MLASVRRPNCTCGVGSRSGVVTLVGAYLLPPLSVGGASLAPSWLYLHLPPHQTVRALFEHTAFRGPSSGSFTTCNTECGPSPRMLGRSGDRGCCWADPDICRPLSSCSPSWLPGIERAAILGRWSAWFTLRTHEIVPRLAAGAQPGRLPSSKVVLSLPSYRYLSPLRPPRGHQAPLRRGLIGALTARTNPLGPPVLLFMTFLTCHP